MEQNIQDILKDKDENVVELSFENNTSNPVAINLFDTATLSVAPTSGNQQTSYTSSGDLLPSLPPSIFAQNPNNGTFISADALSPVLRLINTTTNTTNNNFDNSIGFVGTPNSIITQPDGKILCGGSFLSYKGVTANGIIRLNPDGSKDLTFDNSIGFDAQILSMVLQPDGKIICTGQFTQYKGVTANGIIRLNSDGSKDLTFDNSIGFNLFTWGLALQSDGKIIVGGVFTTYKGVGANRIIRLNSDGSIDGTFVYGTGFNGGILSILIQPDGKIICCGQFTSYNGVLGNNSIIRLNSNGSIDGTFDNSIGFAGGQVNVLNLQPDGKILCGGIFTSYKGISANRIIRLNSDGSIDGTFVYGTGFDSTILSISIQSDGKILCGGNFLSYQGVAEGYIIRLNSDGSKDLTFDNSISFDGNVTILTFQNDGSIFCGGTYSTYKGYASICISKLDSSGNIQSTLNVTATIRDIIYNSNNNLFYGISSTQLYVLSSDAQILVSIFPAFGGTSIQYNSNNNYLYILQGTQIRVFDCATNSPVTNINLGGDFSNVLSEVTPTNEIYLFLQPSNLLQKIDCNTNTLVLINLALPNTISNIRALDYYNGYLYVLSITNNIIDIVDTNTNTYYNSITIPAIYNFQPNFTAINPVTNQLFITDGNITNQKQFAVIDFSTNTFVSVNSLGGIGLTFGLIYNQLTNSMYISGSLFSVVTFTATPFFIGGSVNYNTFVNSLNFEPIFIEEIRILTQNQTQLYNQVQFTKIDSNGNQIFFPEFPITKVDSYQAQGNIASLKLNGLVFDGRTYINQYVINPSQVVSFEIVYKQLDRFSATTTFPIMFKNKVQLKDYIRKDYSDYDVEI